MVEIFPAASNDSIIRVEFFGDEIDRISEINPLTGELKAVLKHAAIYPASHYIVSGDKMKRLLRKLTGSLRKDLHIFVKTESSLRHNDLNSVQGTIWKCCRKSDFVRVSRTIQE